jgi:hypothetical protein
MSVGRESVHTPTTAPRADNGNAHDDAGAAPVSSADITIVSTAQSPLRAAHERQRAMVTAADIRCFSRTCAHRRRGQQMADHTVTAVR